MTLIFTGYAAVNIYGRTTRFIARDTEDPEMVKRGWKPIYRVERTG